MTAVVLPDNYLWPDHRRLAPSGQATIQLLEPRPNYATLILRFCHNSPRSTIILIILIIIIIIIIVET